MNPVAVIIVMNPSDREGRRSTVGTKRTKDEMNYPAQSSLSSTKQIKAYTAHAFKDLHNMMKADSRAYPSYPEPSSSNPQAEILRLLKKGSFQPEYCSSIHREHHHEDDEHGGDPISMLVDPPGICKALEEATIACQEEPEEPDKYVIHFPAGSCNVPSSSSYTVDAKGRKMMAKELRLLCVLRHEHIIQLHYLSSAPSKECELPFVVVDRLSDETLEDKLTPQSSWRSSLRQNGNNDLRSRLSVVRSLASVLEYLHDKRIIYRGLEPSTIGFDAFTGKLKIGSFASARELPAASVAASSCYASGGCFLMTAMVGAQNYMAPENYLREPYGPSADVFSFSVVAWEILSQKRAFAPLSATSTTTTAVRSGIGKTRQQPLRPELDKSWPLLIRNILRFGWARRNATRPSMKAVVAALDQHLHGTPAPSPIAEYISIMLLSNGTFLEY